MTSIMGNPKLSKQFREAMSAPIGSTKREQIKSTLSIMQKVKGLNHDGKGGPFDSMAPASGSVLATPPNFGNMMIFPAAPSLKKQVAPAPAPAPAPTKNTFDLKLSPIPAYGKPLTGNIGDSTNNSFSGIQSYTPSSGNQYGINFKAKEPAPVKTGLVQGSGAPVYSNITSAVKTTTPTPNAPAPKSGTPESLKAYQTYLNNLNKGKSGWVDLKVDGIWGPKTEAAQTFGLTPGTNVTTPTPVNNPVNNTAYSGPKTNIQQAYDIANNKTQPLRLFGRTSNGTLDMLKTALASQESGGNYNTPDSPAGAMGKYQLMPENLHYAGLTDTPENRAKFRASPELQEKAYSAMISALYTKYDGDLSKILAAYYGGGLGASNVGTDDGNLQGKYVYDKINKRYTNELTGFPSVNEYVDQVMQKMDNVDFASTTGDEMSGGSSGIASAQSYIDAGKGSYAYGSDLAKSEFGGKNLTQVIMDNTEAYRKSLEPLEVQLSNLRAESENFVPTLTAYIEGADKYSKAIDSMIKDVEGDLSTKNMADPFVASQYNNQIRYLYTLKNRQNGRYGNYLNSAVADYEADVTKMQSNYDTFKSSAIELLDNQNALDQTTYNDIMTRGEAVYAELENAPIRAKNMQILDQQLGLNNLSTIENGVAGATILNVDLLKDQQTWEKQLSVDNGASDPQNGSLNMNQVGTEGLIGLYSKNYIMNSDQRALTAALKTVLATTLQKSGNDPKKIAEIKKLIDDLRNSGYEESGTWADALDASVAPAATKSLSVFILSNISEIKSAAKDLVKGGLFGKPGIQDKEKWMKNHSSLGADFLESLFNTVNTNIGQGTAYADNPISYINQLFSGQTDEENANNLAARIVTSG